MSIVNNLNTYNLKRKINPFEFLLIIKSWFFETPYIYSLLHTQKDFDKNKIKFLSLKNGSSKNQPGTTNLLP